MTPFWNTLILLTFVLEVVHVFGIPGEAKTYAQAGEFVRTRQLARQETDPTVDPYRTFLHIGYGTDPSQKPRFTTKIRGHLIVDGDVHAQRCIELPPSTIRTEINR
jgi:hypothetical protein